MEKAFFRNFVILSFALLLILSIGFLPSMLSAAPEGKALTISTSYKSLFSNSEKTGMLDRIVKEAFRRTGREAEIVFNPTRRSAMDVCEGLADGELNRIEGFEKNFPDLVRVPEPNMIMDFVAFSRKEFEIDGWDSIKDLHIGIVKGWKILERNTHNFPHVISVPSETELFNMLEKERVDIVLYSRLSGYEQIMLRDLEGISHLEPPLASRNMYLYLNKNHEDLVPLVAQALKSMKEDGTYERIVFETTSHLAGVNKP